MIDNPFAAPTASELSSPQARNWWHKLLAALMLLLAGYYAISAGTLPFVDSVWIGELPVFAVWQLPKVFLHDYAQTFFMWMLSVLGWSSGSPSPDMIATQPYAMMAMVVLPGCVLLGLAAVSRSLKKVSASAIVLVSLAVIDAGVSFWFEQTSRLSLF